MIIKSRELRWFHCGGLLGAFYVTSSAVWIPYVGYSLYFVCLVCGQLFAALLIDWKGLLGSPQLPIQGGRVFGCILTLIGSVMVFLARSIVSHENQGSGSSLSMALGSISAVVSGLILPSQVAVNNVLRRTQHLSTLATTATSLFVGALALLVITGMSYIWIPTIYDARNNQWWHWFGGMLGWIYISASTQFSPIIGYSSFFVAVISGQLLLALISDIVGLLGPIKESAAAPLSVLGVICSASGAVVVSVYKAAGLKEADDLKVAGGGNGELSKGYVDVGAVIELGTTRSPMNCSESEATSD